MKERGVGTPWTTEEDNLLRTAVALYGECDNWKQVALSVPGRTNKACRKRWLHSLSPEIKKTAWTAEEDSALLSLYDTHGPKWSVIARKISGRTDDACSKRYREALDPSLKKDEWTHEEDCHLREVYGRLGGKWGDIGRELNRSGLACRNRWRMLERKKAAAARNAAAHSSDPLSAPEVLPGQLPGPADPTALSWSSSAPIDPQAFWQNHSSEYSRLIPGAQPAPQSSPYIHFSPLSDTSQELHSTPSSPPPFQFTSSSLSSALSIPARSSSHIDAGSPDQLISPVIVQAISLSALPDTTFHEAPPIDAPPHLTIHDAISSNVERPDHDTARHAEAGPSQDGAAGRAPSPVNIPSTSPLLSPTSPSGEIPSLSRLSSLGTAGADSDHYVSSPLTSDFHRSAAENAAELSMQSLSRESSASSVGTAGEDINVSPPPTTTIASYYRTPAEKAAKPPTPRKRLDRSGAQPRLSSKLAAASDTLAYACGHPQCWPPDATSSLHCFLTSQQLSDHWKADHISDDIGSNSFRCSLAGCGKGWKSINGLQYHLQISKAHFQRALANIPMPEADPSPPSDGSESAKGGNRSRKIYACPHSQCRNQYKQLSGLRYHLTHGHSQELPAQLDSVPPALAQKFSQKLQKHANQLRMTD